MIIRSSIIIKLIVQDEVCKKSLHFLLYLFLNAKDQVINRGNEYKYYISHLKLKKNNNVLTNSRIISHWQIKRFKDI